MGTAGQYTVTNYRIKSKPKFFLPIFFVFFASCASNPPLTTLIGNFRLESDLFLAQFDCKTDVDDIHSIAGVTTILTDPRFSDVRYHAVAGTYGIQEGPYVPANELFEASFGDNWSDAHSNYKGALREVTHLVTNVLKDGGNIWIAEAGQSDFSADLVRNIKTALPNVNTTVRIHIVQHSDWNENNTAPDNLSFIKASVCYHKIPDGNTIGNGSPGFKSDEIVKWQDYINNPVLLHIWEIALEIANKYNGKENRYNNPAIASGGMDFSDVSETCWIFGFDYLENIQQFFEEFSTSSDL
jgi:hypothetical protein